MRVYTLSKDPPRSMNLLVSLTPITSLQTISTTMLLDSGATGMFVSKDFIQKHKLETTSLPLPIPIHNIDGTPNKHGSITEEIEVILQYGDHSEQAKLAVINPRCQMLIIRYPWI